MTQEMSCSGSGSGRTAHLKLVRYQPPGSDAQVCAAVWEESGHVHLASPLLTHDGGLLDPQRFARQFGEFSRLDLFEQAMSALDAACYSSTRTYEVREICEEHPEWDLRCERFDATDESLGALHSLIQAAGSRSPLPIPALRHCLVETVARILELDKKYKGAQIEKTFGEGDDVAVLEMASGLRVLVTTRHDVESSMAVSPGVAAHYRALKKSRGADKCLLVLPGLVIDKPMKLTSLSAISSADPVVIRAALRFLTNVKSNDAIAQ